VHLRSFIRSAWSTTLSRWRFHFGRFGVVCSFAATHHLGLTVVAHNCLSLPFADFGPGSVVITRLLSKLSRSALSQLTPTDSLPAAWPLTERILMARLLLCVVDISIQIGFFHVFEHLGLNWDATTGDGFLGWICMMGGSGVEHQVLVLPFLERSLRIQCKLVENFGITRSRRIPCQRLDKRLWIRHRGETGAHDEISRVIAVGLIGSRGTVQEWWWKIDVRKFALMNQLWRFILLLRVCRCLVVPDFGFFLRLL